MKHLFLFLFVAAAVMTGCNGDDIDELRDKTNALDERVTALEDMQKTLWDNIQALQAIINYCCPIKLDNNKNSVLDC